MSEQLSNNRADVHVVAFVGGGSADAVLPTLNQAFEQVTAVTSSADDGGSTGRLRREQGIPPVGDARQALVALSESPERHTWQERDSSGHAIGNLLISDRIKARGGDFMAALQDISARLELRDGTRVLPATVEPTTLELSWRAGESILGEDAISRHDFQGRRSPNIRLRPGAVELNPLVAQAVAEADIILVAPSNLYCSAAPIIVTPGMQAALQASPAQKVYVPNLLTRKGHTEGMTAVDHAREINRFMGGHLLDTVFANADVLTGEMAQKYLHEGETFVQSGDASCQQFDMTLLPLLSKLVQQPQPGDQLASSRSRARHDIRPCIQQLLQTYRVLEQVS